MKSKLLLSQHSRIEWLLSQAFALQQDQFELRAHWARYLCVLVAGFIENGLQEVYSSYTKNCANPSVANFVEASLGRIQNPKGSRFVEIAKAFDPEWEDALLAFLRTDGRKEAIDAIMSNRHLIAHGKDSGISLVRVKDYLKKAVDVIDFIEEQCNL